jgi:hypothetical protein
MPNDPTRKDLIERLVRLPLVADVYRALARRLARFTAS